MFLVYLAPPRHTIEYILKTIEDNSVLIGVITSLIVGSLWFEKFIRQRRAEAFFGFYSKLSLNIRILQDKLEENDRLNITDFNIGNIYSLIYVEKDIMAICKSFTPVSKEELDSYKAVADVIKDIIMNTENNVYPQKSNREEWYKSQGVLLFFCDFLDNEGSRHTTNIPEGNGNAEPKHITKCKELVKAMNYIQEAINKARY